MTSTGRAVAWIGAALPVVGALQTWSGPPLGAGARKKTRVPSGDSAGSWPWARVVGVPLPSVAARRMAVSRPVPGLLRVESV